MHWLGKVGHYDKSLHQRTNYNKIFCTPEINQTYFHLKAQVDALVNSIYFMILINEYITKEPNFIVEAAPKVLQFNSFLRTYYKIMNIK